MKIVDTIKDFKSKIFMIKRQVEMNGKKQWLLLRIREFRLINRNVIKRWLGSSLDSVIFLYWKGYDYKNDGLRLNACTPTIFIWSVPAMASQRQINSINFDFWLCLHQTSPPHYLKFSLFFQQCYGIHAHYKGVTPILNNPTLPYDFQVRIKLRHLCW